MILLFNSFYRVPSGYRIREKSKSVIIMLSAGGILIGIKRINAKGP